ncbi:MAG: hypothetical protein VX973_00865, partial [Pseudomonadota bacterium]|nr:hypothetical protein [Pseudomonadota bacterium]
MRFDDPTRLDRMDVDGHDFEASALGFHAEDRFILRAGTLVEAASSKSFGHALLSLHFRDGLPSPAARALAEVLRQFVT